MSYQKRAKICRSFGSWSAIITRELGLTTQVVGSHTAAYFMQSAMLREFAGVLIRNPWPLIVVAAGVVLVGTLAGLLR